MGVVDAGTRVRYYPNFSDALRYGKDGIENRIHHGNRGGIDGVDDRDWRGDGEDLYHAGPDLVVDFHDGLVL
jgi:hypothetical protein